MKIYLDTSNIEEIKKFKSMSLIDGVTTNPSIFYKEGNTDIEKISKKIAEIIYPLPLNIEVLSDVPEEVERQAKIFSKWAENIVIKIPIISETGVMLTSCINKLEDEGIKTNCTACMSFNQAMLAAKAGASYISIFVGRINDEGGNGYKVVENICTWLDKWNYKSEVIAASLRESIDIQETALSNSHILTIPPKIMTKISDHQNSRKTVKEFNAASKNIII